jgi:pyruvate/2-oxoglutarate/acetoin dehydrogenase E1 component
MSTYLSAVNGIIAAHVNRLERALVFGENVDRGSFLSGLSRNLTASDTRRIVNVGNCEYTHCGVGFGAMMGGATAVLFVKQLDFMLLGVDHFVSTYHSIRASQIPQLGSFTIVAAVYDQGYQGPQSSFNALADVCSMARISAFTLTNAADAEAVASKELSAPGFRILALSQRCANEPVYLPESVQQSADCSTFLYEQGADLSVVCANFSLPQGLALASALRDAGVSSSVLSVNPVYAADWSLLLGETARTKHVLVLDDGKGVNGLGSMVAQMLQQRQPATRVHLHNRPPEISFGVSAEAFVPPAVGEVAGALGLAVS